MKKLLLYKYYRCETTPNEEKKIAEWLDAAPENQGEFEADRRLFEAIALYSPECTASKADPAKALRSRRLRLLRRYASSSAAVVALALIAGFLMNTKTRSDIQAQAISMEVPAGQRISMKLQDGTSVWLNSGARLEYPVMFGRTRRVKLEGEALFNVANDKSHPFVVETFSCDIEVLGTRFNVIADKENNLFSTALMEGRIKVTNNMGNGESVILRPDQKTELINGLLFTSLIGNMDDYRWNEGILTLKGMKFTELMNKFELVYGVDIVVETTDIPTFGYGGKIRISDGVEHALLILQRISDFTFEKNDENNVIYIR